MASYVVPFSFVSGRLNPVEDPGLAEIKRALSMQLDKKNGVDEQETLRLVSILKRHAVTVKVMKDSGITEVIRRLRRKINQKGVLDKQLESLLRFGGSGNPMENGTLVSPSVKAARGARGSRAQSASRPLALQTTNRQTSPHTTQPESSLQSHVSQHTSHVPRCSTNGTLIETNAINTASNEKELSDTNAAGRKRPRLGSPSSSKMQKCARKDGGVKRGCFMKFSDPLFKDKLTEAPRPLLSVLNKKNIPGYFSDSSSESDSSESEDDSASSKKKQSKFREDPIEKTLEEIYSQLPPIDYEAAAAHELSERQKDAEAAEKFMKELAGV